MEVINCTYHINNHIKEGAVVNACMGRHLDVVHGHGYGSTPDVAGVPTK